jgi:hypothetical protein
LGGIIKREVTVVLSITPLAQYLDGWVL